MGEEGLGVVDPVHVEHAHASLADAERQRERRGDVAVGLQVAAEVVVLRIPVELHRLEPLGDPAGDPLAHALGGVLRELGLEAVGGAGLEHPGRGVVDHDRGLLRAQGGDDAPHDDLEDGLEPQLEAEHARELEQLGQLGEPDAHRLLLELLLRQRAADRLELPVLEGRIEAEDGDQAGERDEPDVRVGHRAGRGVLRAQSLEQRQVEERDRPRQYQDQRDRGAPERPAVPRDRPRMILGRRQSRSGLPLIVWCLPHDDRVIGGACGGF